MIAQMFVEAKFLMSTLGRKGGKLFRKCLEH